MAARICCLDLDTFFVSVERLFEPRLQGKPVVVGGARGSRGVVTAASYEVRAYGVRSGMSMREASRLAPPETVFLPTRHGIYGSYSERVRTILERYTPDVRTGSIDEFYLDFRGCEKLYRRAPDEDGNLAIERAVRAMCQAIQRETGLPASAGIGQSRIIAKIASGRAKPKGVLLVPPGSEQAFLLPLPVRKFPGIGPKAEARMAADGIQVLGDLACLPKGSKRARYAGILGVLQRELSGEARAPSLARERPAFREYDPEGLRVGSISNERTFFDGLRDDARVLEQLLRLVERVCWRARKRGIRARTVTLKLRHSDFHTVIRSRGVEPTADEGLVLRVVSELYRGHGHSRLAIRLLGVALSNLLGADDGTQLLLPFPCTPPATPQVGRAMDQVRRRFGYHSVHLGLPATEPEGVPPNGGVREGVAAKRACAELTIVRK